MNHGFASKAGHLTSARRALAFAIVVAALGCKGKPAVAEGGDLFTLTPVLTLEADGQGHARLTIAAAPGYKWNQEFPFKLVVDEQVGVTLSKTTFSKPDAAVAADGHTAHVDLGVTGRLSRDARLKGKASFSVCDDKVCKVYRNREVVWALSAGGATARP